MSETVRVDVGHIDLELCENLDNYRTRLTGLLVQLLTEVVDIDEIITKLERLPFLSEEAYMLMEVLIENPNSSMALLQEKTCIPGLNYPLFVKLTNQIKSFIKKINIGVEVVLAGAGKTHQRTYILLFRQTETTKTDELQYIRPRVTRGDGGKHIQQIEWPDIATVIEAERRNRPAEINLANCAIEEVMDVINRPPELPPKFTLEQVLACFGSSEWLSLETVIYRITKIGCYLTDKEDELLLYKIIRDLISTGQLITDGYGHARLSDQNS